MSIFESIQAAERKAEEIRAQAMREADALLERTRIESEEKAKELYAEASSRELKINEEIEREVLRKTGEIEAQTQKTVEELRNLVEERKGHAVDFILGKVFEL
ncbi:MAG TPA: hypothetical protein GYA05_01235 [Acholeplasmataceae bacterium]|jgi:vacuolar-type H+-ATPase subunit H|nr:hypothetical protein [Acholeplasmataceae bacterium]